MDFKLILSIVITIAFKAAFCDLKVPETTEGGGKIVGGQITDVANVPYTISLMYNTYHQCGGSILSDVWILSAAHCAPAGYKTENFTVRSGSSRKRRGGSVHSVESVYVHPNFSMSTLDSDFMLIKLKDPIIFDEKRQPIKLADSYMYFDNAEVLTAGFGETKNPLESNEFLRAVMLRMTSSEACVNAYKSMITKNMFCAAAKNKDSCQGDSGGPVESGYYGTLVGVVSFGVSCADEQYPGVYSKVSEAKEWIESITNSWAILSK